MAKRNKKGSDICSALIRLASHALSLTSPDRAITGALKEIRKTFNARICWMFLAEDNKIELVGLGDTKSRRDLAKSRLLLKLSPGILKRTYPRICNRIGELYKDDRVLHRFLSGRGIQKFMGVPLQKDGRPIGVLNVGRDDGSPDFTQDDLKALAALGSVMVLGGTKAAQEESKRAQDFLGAVIDNIPNPIFIKDRKHRWVVLNRAISDLLGYPREEMLGRSDFDFFPKTQANFFWKKDEQMFRTGRVVDVPEEPITDVEGKVHYLHTKKAPLRDSSGRITHLVGIIEDITERKRAEDELKESEQRFRAIYQRATDGILLADLESKRFYTGNEMFCQMLGYSLKEIQKLRVRDIHPKKDLPRVMDEFEKQARGEITLAENIPMKRKDGSVFYADVNSTPIRLGGKTYLMGVFRDITERKQMEQALIQRERAARERARLLSDLRSLDRIDDILTRVCAAVRESGLFERAVMTLNEPGGQIIHLGQVGLPASVVKRARQAHPIDRKLRSRVTSKRFRISDSYFVPVEAALDFSKSGRHVPQKRRTSVDGDWQPGDELFVPLRDFSGEIMGYLSADTPTEGGRPDIKMISVLEMMVEAAASRIREVRAQKALRESEETARALLNAPQDVALLADPDGTIVALNETTAKRLGKSLHELLGTSVFDLFPPEVVELRRAQGKKAIRSGKPVRFEDQRAGRWFDQNVYPVFNAEGKVTRLAIFAHDITDRKRAEEALQRSEARYRSLFEDSPISLWEEDFSEVKNCIDRLRDSGIKNFRQYFETHPKAVARCAAMVRVVDVNKVSLKMYKAANKEELKSGLGKIFARESYYPFRDELISIAEGKTVFEKEAVTQTLKGDKNYVTVRWTVSPGHEKTLSKVVVAISDITERRRAEEALREGEEKFRTLAEQSPNMIFIYKQGQVIYANDRCERVMGYRREEFYSPDFDFLVLIAPEYRELLKSSVARHAAGAEVDPYECAIIPKKGKRIQVIISTKLISYGGENAVLGIITDITERKRAEEALQASERQHRTLVETAQEGIGIVDPKENLTFVNRAFADLLGYPKNELVGKNLRDISDRSQYAMFKRETERRGKGGSSKYEAKLLTKKGRSKDVYVSAAPLFGEDGEFAGTMGVVSDLTQIKKAREYNILLETSRALSRTLKFDQVLKTGAERMIQTLNAHRCAVLLTTDGTTVNTVTAQIYSTGRLSAPKTVKLKTTKAHLAAYRRTLRARGCIQISDARTDLVPELGRKIIRRADITSGLIIPILLRDKMLGVFHVGVTKEFRAFSSDEVRLALTMTNQLAVALQNCTLMENLREDHSRIVEQTRLLAAQFREQKMMFELTRALTSARSLDQLLKVATQKTVQLLEAERSSIGLVDPGGISTTIRAVYPKRKTGERKVIGFTFTLSQFPQLKQVLIQRKPLILPDISDLPKDDPARGYFLSRGIKSTVAVPLVSRGKNLGFLTVATMKQPHHYTREEMRLLQTISNPIAVTIENYLLLEDLRQKYTQIEQQAAVLRKQTREKDILLKVSRALSKAMSLDEVSQVASQVVRSALGVDRCAVLLTTEGGDRLEVKGLLSKRPKDARMLIGKMFPWEDVSGVSKAVRKGKPFVVSNTRDLPLRSKVRKHCLEMGAKSVLGTGMFFGRKLLGILSVTSISEYRTFSSEEIKLVQTMANQIAVAIENARLLEVVRKHTQDLHGLSSQLMEVQEKERKRIAQELHDQVGQMLQSMRMNLGRIKRDLGSRSEEPKGKEDWLLDTEELLDQTIEDIRTLTSDLSPPMLVDFGLIPTLRWYIESYGKRSGIKVSLRAKEKGYRLSQDIEFSLFRIIQEALTNVFKHARATEASVSVSKKDSSVIMSVRDNGVGFDPRETLSPPKGMGLFGIKERVNLLGGNFEIISRPRKGTTLNINIPFSEVKYEEGQTTGG